MTFVDFKKAFDSVDKDTLWSLLRHYGVPDKMVMKLASYMMEQQHKDLK